MTGERADTEPFALREIRARDKRSRMLEQYKRGELQDDKIRQLCLHYSRLLQPEFQNGALDGAVIAKLVQAEQMHVPSRQTLFQDSSGDDEQ